MEGSNETDLLLLLDLGNSHRGAGSWVRGQSKSAVISGRNRFVSTWWQYCMYVRACVLPGQGEYAPRRPHLLAGVAEASEPRVIFSKLVFFVCASDAGGEELKKVPAYQKRKRTDRSKTCARWYFVGQPSCVRACMRRVQRID